MPPNIDHSHAESSSIAEGLTYYGTRLPELYATHIYSDFDAGKFWGFRYVDGRIVDHRELADTSHRVVGFGQDPNGEIVLRDAQDKVIRIPSPQVVQLVPQRQSLMPDVLFRDMTGQQLADLLAYLSSLK